MFLHLPTEVLLQVLGDLTRQDLDRLFLLHPRTRALIKRYNKSLPQSSLNMVIKHPGNLGTKYSFIDLNGKRRIQVDGLTRDARKPLRTRWLLTPYFFGRRVAVVYFYTALEVVTA